MKLLIDILDRWGMVPTFKGMSGMKQPLCEQEQARKVKTRFRLQPFRFAGERLYRPTVIPR